MLQLTGADMSVILPVTAGQTQVDGPYEPGTADDGQCQAGNKDKCFTLLGDRRCEKNK